nr:JAB domain-containing protein [uncultured Winogradskyella sp.]
MIHIKGSKDVYRTMKDYINSNRICHKEFFWLMLLSCANRVVGIADIASGGTNGVHINLKEIFQFILLTNASSFIAIHNHPSGNLNPSVSDYRITKKLQKLAMLIDSSLVDHLIVSQEGYYSFSDHHAL